MADLSDESIEALWARHGQFSHDFAREVIAADRALNAAQPAPEPTDPTKWPFPSTKPPGSES